LARIDRAFLNLDFASLFPGSLLSTGNRPTSDHSPLIATIQTNIPKATYFRLERSWLLNPSFVPLALQAWLSAPQQMDPAGSLVAQVKATRQASKVWARKHRSPPYLYHNYNFIISLFDHFEEFRDLNAGERCLRDICYKQLDLFLRQKAAYWKQRAKVRCLREGDSNTKYFHVKASCRKRRNFLASITVNGSTVTSHEDKSKEITQYFKQILGSAVQASWNFQVADLYQNQNPPLDSLISQFFESEALEAIKSMNVNSAPGPDGLGPAWYKAVWASVKGDIMRLLHAFHNCSIELDRINRAHIVLIPKREGASSPSEFRPISLQNCPVKIISKILTTRLQKHIQQLVDIDQTGFIRGRSISENFVYATELVQFCHKNKKPTIVLKLDFAKAFDSVCWDSLLRILSARGFPHKWNQWILHLLQTSHSAVLVNGCPGNWIRCKRGLRQGDALSPYLFLLVADVLQRLIKTDNGIRHPVCDGPCPVLQYADDTLLLLRADVADVTRLKAVLDSFAMATGLKINFSKSTLIPMHVQQETISVILQTLQCTQGAFPQSYLGLPLSNSKLKLSAFAPLISKVDRRLAT